MRGIGNPQVGSTLPAQLTLTGSPAPVDTLAFSPDEHTLATAAADTVTLWNPAAGRAAGHLTPDPGAPVNALAFAGTDAKTLVTGGGDDKIQLWDITDPTHPTRLGNALRGHTSHEFDGSGESDRSNVIYAIAISPDGHTLAVGGGRRDIARGGRSSEKYQADATVQLWDISHRATPVKLGHPLKGHTGAVNAITFSPDGKTLAATGTDQTIRLWDAPTGDTWDVLTPP